MNKMTTLKLYEQNDYTKAAQQFEECLSQNPLDTVADIYLKRCRQNDICS